MTFEAGKQFVRWGKADVLNPTDRFAPRDLLEVVDNDFLGVTARPRDLRAGAGHDRRWSGCRSSRPAACRWPAAGGRRRAAAVDRRPPPVVSAPPADLGVGLPLARPQAGVRWNHVGSGFEFSLSYFDGFNNLPRIDVVTEPVARPRRGAPRLLADADGRRRRRLAAAMVHAQGRGRLLLDDRPARGRLRDLRHPGGAAAGRVALRRRLRWRVRDRRTGPSPSSPLFAFDRGLADTFLGRASYTIDPLRSLAFEGAIRYDAAGGWFRAEYSRAFGQHWRATARGDLLAGAPDDFFGRYRRNSSLRLTVRYSY